MQTSLVESGFKKTINRQSVVNEIIDRITSSIISGELRPGSRIPTEMELCSMWGVSRNSLREAIKCLVYIGVLEIRRSEGTFVANGINERMLNPLIYSLMLEERFSESLVELRRIFDVGSLQLAIKKATEDDIIQIHEAYNKLVNVLEKKDIDIDEVLRSDVEFHQKIISATYNPLVNRISTVITELTIPSREVTTQQLIYTKNQQFMIDVHYKLYNAIKTRDLSNIIELIDNHYSLWEALLVRRN